MSPSAFVPSAMQKQANFSKECKALGVKSTKIYYTTRYEILTEKLAMF